MGRVPDPRPPALRVRTARADQVASPALRAAPLAAGCGPGAPALCSHQLWGTVRPGWGAGDGRGAGFWSSLPRGSWAGSQPWSQPWSQLLDPWTKLAPRKGCLLRVRLRRGRRELPPVLFPPRLLLHASRNRELVSLPGTRPKRASCWAWEWESHWVAWGWLWRAPRASLWVPGGLLLSQPRSWASPTAWLAGLVLLAPHT